MLKEEEIGSFDKRLATCKAYVIKTLDTSPPGHSVLVDGQRQKVNKPQERLC